VTFRIEAAGAPASTALLAQACVAMLSTATTGTALIAAINSSNPLGQFLIIPESHSECRFVPLPKAWIWRVEVTLGQSTKQS
jgi:hypothetical protein